MTAIQADRASEQREVAKRVVLKLGEGSLEQGFPVTLQCGEEGQAPRLETVGWLPAAPELRQAYQTWAAIYQNLHQQLQIEEDTLQESHASRRETCNLAARTLADSLNSWLYASSFRPIQETLLEQVMPSEPVRLIVQTENSDLRHLPWPLWDFCDRYPQAEIVLSASGYSQREAASRPERSGIRILGILGNGQGIDAPTDRRLLEQLPQAHIQLLVEPTGTMLIQEWRQNWDLLCFTGHRLALSEQQMALNSTDALNREQLKLALRRLVERGLQIAILNSGDGLELAQILEDVQIPHLVVMRQPVPDSVMQEFFKAFLTAFARALPFALAVRQARETLRGLEDVYPCVTWMPVVCQHPAAIPPTWQALGGEPLTLIVNRAELPSATRRPAEQAAAKTSLIPEIQSDLINDRYQIQKMLGQGGFGRTFLAADTYRFGDLCVLKQFAPANSAPKVLERARELFEREAKVLYQISHPQIPKFLAWFTQEDQLFIVEEFIDGPTYLALLQERQQQGRTFSEAEIVQWLKDLLPVLDYLHQHHIIHRDISPGNVMLPRGRSQPVLIDFGVVKEVASQIWSLQVGSFQQPHQVSRVGKPGYAPLEQMQLGQCYPCSDLYALGMTALVLLTGRNPQWLLAQQKLHPDAPDLPALAPISAPVQRVLSKLVAENPRQRYSSAQAVLADLGSVSQSAPLSAPPPPSEVTTIAPPAIAPLPLPPGFLEQCQQELVRYVGPMGAYLVEDILAEQPQLTARELIDLLVAEIPDPSQARQFQARIQSSLQPPTQIRPPAPLAELPTVEHSSSRRGAPVNPAPLNAARSPETGLSSPAFIHQCRHELARLIGPMADCIVDDILEQSPQLTPAQLIQAITAEIPNPKQAETFRQALRRVQ